MANFINKLFTGNGYVWNVDEYFRNDQDLVDGVCSITNILNLDENKIEGKIEKIDRVNHTVRVAFKKESDRKVYMLGSDKYVCSYGRSYNVTY